ncbi:MAG: prepilin-type processing-associated H-X9-DG protein [Mariniblastus sp.]|jgi:prepilin-type processing-associated H-X9-DG protein
MRRTRSYCRSVSHLVALLAAVSLTLGSSLTQAQVKVDILGLAKLAPDDCLLYAHWEGMAKADANSENRTQQLMAEPEVVAFTQQLKKNIAETVQLATQNQPVHRRMFAMAVADKLISDVNQTPFSVFISGVTPGPEGVQAQAAAVIQLGQEAKPLIDLATGFLMTEQIELKPLKIAGYSFHELPQPHPQLQSKLYLGAVEGYVIIGLGKATVEFTIDKINNSKSAPQWLASQLENSPYKKRHGFGFINLESGIKHLLPMAGLNNANIVSVLGLDSLQSITTESGLDQRGMLSRTQVNFSGEPRGLIKLLAAKPLNLEQLKQFPADSLFAAGFSLDLGDLYDEAVEIASQQFPAETNEFLSQAQGVTQATGIDVVEDLIKHLGNTWTMHSSPSDGMLAGIMLGVEVTDAKALQATIERVQRLLGSNPRAPRIQSRDYQGQTLYQVLIPEIPIAPSFAIINGKLCVTGYVQNLKPLVDKSPTDRFLDVPALLPTSAKEAVQFTYYDGKLPFETIYMYLTLLSGAKEFAMTELPGEPGQLFATLTRDLDLPSARSIHRHVTPSISYGRQTETGMLYETRQTIPSVNLAVIAPIGVGMLLPAVQQVREAARQVTSANNLRQQMLAMHNFESTFQQFPTAYTADADGKKLLSWRVHILQFLEEGQLYDQFKLDEPWDSPHNLTLLEKMPEVFQCPTSNAPPGKTIYLGNVSANGFLVPPQNGQGISFGKITDGTSNTIGIIEASDSYAVDWTKPEVDLNLTRDNFFDFLGQSGSRAGSNIAWCDGSVQFMSVNIELETFLKLLTRNGGEVVPVEDYDF